MSAETVWTAPALVPIAMISAPRSIPAVSAGVPSNVSATKTRRLTVS
jgi:hypothetical protein